MLALSGCAEATTAQSAVDYPYYASTADLFESADLVVEVTLGDGRAGIMLPMDSDSDDPRLNPNAGVTTDDDEDVLGVPVTVFTATVTAVHRGDAASGDVIDVQQMRDAAASPLESGVDRLLFLETSEASPASILGGDAGAFEPVGDGFASLDDGRLRTTRLQLDDLG